MITAFMVFKREHIGPRANEWRLYFTTTSDRTPEHNIREQASREGWRVVTVEFDDDLKVVETRRD